MIGLFQEMSPCRTMISGESFARHYSELLNQVYHNLSPINLQSVEIGNDWIVSIIKYSS